MSSIALVAMPFASPHHPNIGLSILKSVLQANSIACDIHNFYLHYVEYAGIANFKRASDDSLYKALIGEWIFCNALREVSASDSLKYITDVLEAEYPAACTYESIMSFIKMHRKSPEFIDQCLESVDWNRYKIVGFSSSFQQHAASLALAKRIKKISPGTIIVFGGANVDGEMGCEILRSYEFVDAAFSGESERTFLDFVQNVLASSKSPQAIRREFTSPIIAEVATELDTLPVPDFSHFYLDLKELPQTRLAFRAVPLFESARGCWWGEKKHCTFCGLNGSSMNFRSKSASKAIEELKNLSEKHGREILVVDNIIDFEYFKEFIPALSKFDPNLLLHYETKVNLSSERIKLFASGGIRKIQPGIESLSTRILRLMNKGCTMIQNVQTLKLCAEAGIYVEWGFLYGFPGENPDDYKPLPALVDLLTHLQPPAGITRVRADRFSPYFKTPELYGIEIKPFEAYRYVYEHDDKASRRSAYHFEICCESLEDCEFYTAETRKAIREWNDTRSSQQLYMRMIADCVEVVDTRTRFGVGRRLWKGDFAQILFECTTATSVRRLQEKFNKDRQEIMSDLCELSNAGLIVVEGELALSLPLRQPGYKRALESYQIREPLSQAYMFAN